MLQSLTTAPIIIPVLVFFGILFLITLTSQAIAWAVERFKARRATPLRSEGPVLLCAAKVVVNPDRHGNWQVSAEALAVPRETWGGEWFIPTVVAASGWVRPGAVPDAIAAVMGILAPDGMRIQWSDPAGVVVNGCAPGAISSLDDAAEAAGWDVVYDPASV